MRAELLTTISWAARSRRRAWPRGCARPGRGAQRCALAPDLEKALHTPRLVAGLADAFEAFGDGAVDRFGHGLARDPGELLRAMTGLLVLDVEAHGPVSW